MRIAPFLFGSGFCALVYQTAWQRELRLVFGASTAASAAVLAIFMAGLGLGSALLGARADKHKRPLELYGNLEGLIALSAAATPVLVWLTRKIYVALGGTLALGLVGGTLVRLVLSALLLAVPTLLMGGTLPAAARAAETAGDVRRRALAVLYGVNTLGAVAGATASTFFLFEVFGTQQTLWLACLVNGLIAVGARVASRSLPEDDTAEAPATAEAGPATAATPEGAVPSRAFALGAAAMVGFVFFLMELVWYRLLAPLLGGSTFTFGLILMVVLLGIGLGGAAYSTWGKDRPATLRGFALTCMLEALFIAVPYALGDRIAVLAALTRQLDTFGFSGLVLGWGVVAAVVMLPAAFVSGVQFPLLLALLGRGRENVGRQVGLAYAWNTVGSIVGSLAGGFGLMPLLTAPGCWRLVVGLLAALGGVAMALSLRGERQPRGLLLPGAAGALALGLLTALGPTSAWRHSAIGAGRTQSAVLGDINSRRAWQETFRRIKVWEAEGLESSVGLLYTSGYAFVVNGKSDGNAVNDAATQVMGGLTGAMLHPHPRRALVIGLGTGSSAGWLAKVPEMERVDVVEIEPAILEVARRCEGVNEGALDNPKLHVFIGDAREVLLTTPQQYDIIFSEPSNPYRAGISSLFTREFYEAARSKLAPGGIFVQWLQNYEIDGPTLRSVYATLSSEFGAVETWETVTSDLLLVASDKPLVHDVEALRARITQPPYRKALAAAWRTHDAEGVLAHFLGGPGLAQRLAKGQEHLINTDDLSYMEFGIARTMGRQGIVSDEDLRQLAQEEKADRPALQGTLDWEHERAERAYNNLLYVPTPQESLTLRQRVTFARHAMERDIPGAVRLWRKAGLQPRGITELGRVGEVLARTGDEAALPIAEQLRADLPTDADALVAMMRFRQGRLTEAATQAQQAFQRLRTEPWASKESGQMLLEVALGVAQHEPTLGHRMLDALGQSFSTGVFEAQRLEAQYQLAKALGWLDTCQQVLKPVEPNVTWSRDYLTARYSCYEAHKDPLRERALTDLEEFLAAEPSRLREERPEMDASGPAPLKPESEQENSEPEAPHAPPVAEDQK